MASVLSQKLAESVSPSTLTCKLKSSIRMLFGFFGSKSMANVVKSSRNIVFVVLFLREYGGWYIPVSVISLFFYTDLPSCILKWACIS